MTFKKIFPLIILLVLFIVGPTYAIYMMGSAETGATVNSSYQGQFNGTRDNTITTLAIIKPIGFILAIVILVIVIRTGVKRFK